MAKVDDNIMTSMHDNFSLNTTVIDEWQDPDSGSNHIHTIDVRIIKQTYSFRIGIIYDEYDLKLTLVQNFVCWYTTEGI